MVRSRSGLVQLEKLLRHGSKRNKGERTDVRINDSAAQRNYQTHIW